MFVCSLRALDHVCAKEVRSGQFQSIQFKAQFCNLPGYYKWFQALVQVDTAVICD